MAELSDLQKRLVQSSFTALAVDVDASAALFYGHLFAQDPTLRALFKSDMVAQGRKLLGTLAVLVHGLDDLAAAAEIIAKLGKEHVDYGVEREHFRMAEASLLYTAQKMLGEDYTEEIGAAWQTTYRIIESVIVESAYAE